MSEWENITTRKSRSASPIHTLGRAEFETAFNQGGKGIVFLWPRGLETLHYATDTSIFQHIAHPFRSSSVPCLGTSAPGVPAVHLLPRLSLITCNHRRAAVLVMDYRSLSFALQYSLAVLSVPLSGTTLSFPSDVDAQQLVLHMQECGK